MIHGCKCRSRWTIGHIRVQQCSDDRGGPLNGCDEFVRYITERLERRVKGLTPVFSLLLLTINPFRLVLKLSSKPGWAKKYQELQQR
jgi:hypothetical protein